jgi:replication factor A1
MISTDFIKIDELNTESREVNTIAKVVSKTAVREVYSRKDYSTHRVCEALVGDETASILLTLWDDNIEKVNEEDTLKIENGHVNLFRGSMRLNIGRYGSFDKVEESPIAAVNTENNVSEKQYEQRRRHPRFPDQRRSYRRRY